MLALEDLKDLIFISHLRSSPAHHLIQPRRKNATPTHKHRERACNNINHSCCNWNQKLTEPIVAAAVYHHHHNLYQTSPQNRRFFAKKSFFNNSTTMNPSISLFRSLLREAKKVDNYNFRSYAIRRVKLGFELNRSLAG